MAQPTEFAQRPGCLAGIARLFGGSAKEAAPTYPFKQKAYFLSKAELSFYQVLKSALQDKAVICPKIRLSDVIAVEIKSQGHWNQLSQKHLDFLLCRPDTMQPLLAIELDDSTHKAEKATKGDNFKNEALKAAGLPLLRMSAKRGYNPDEIRDQIRQALKTLA